MQIQIELTKELIEFLSPEEIKRILITLISSNGINTPSKEDRALNSTKIDNSGTTITPSTITPKAIDLSLNESESELTTEIYSEIKAKYAEGLPELPELCRKYNVSYSVVYGRLYRQGLIKKKT